MQETFKMELTGLTSDSEYEVRLRAMNSQGWSQLSNPFQFRTAGRATARAGASSPTIPVQNSRYRNSKGWSQLSNPFQFRTAGTATARAGASSPTLSSSEQQVQ
jgi:hypothetical protein